MKNVASCFVVILCLLISVKKTSAEGTKQVMPTSTAKGQLCLDKARNDFAFYNGSQQFRLNVTIADTSESIRFGLGEVTSNSPGYNTQTEYRISDPLGNTVFGPFPVPASGAGYIKTYTEAITGPFPGIGGYNYLEIKPLHTGNYYFEFYYAPQPSGGYSSDHQRRFDYFDITVVDSLDDALDGRVWSKAWQFWSDTPVPPPTNNRFYGKLLILSDDSIVTQLDGNGFIGGTFSVSCNSTGCDNTGDNYYDRQSRRGFNTYPQYKIFLNDPDSSLYPTQKVHSGIVGNAEIITDCTGFTDIKLKVSKDGTVEILIDINPKPGADQEDIKYVVDVKANPGGDGYNHIYWNGLDGVGNPVINGTKLTVSTTYLSGLTHLPIHDIEYNDHGYIVKQIRPKGGQLTIYWDDTNLGGSENSVVGCVDPSGCHTWNSSIGDNNTVNSWWYVTISATVPTPLTMMRTPIKLVSLIDNNSPIHCIGILQQVYFVEKDPNATNYKWSYSGKNVTIDDSITKATLHFNGTSTPGILSVYGNNPNCEDGPTASLPISFHTLPEVTISINPTYCYTMDTVKLTGGYPEGGFYTYEGMKTDTILPYKESVGDHPILYTYTDEFGCTNYDSTGLVIRTGDDCETKLNFPNAFTPNNDNLNDLFHPLGQYIYGFTLYVYNRWGQLIFTSENSDKGWDGTSNGKPCPAGLYAFYVVYRLSLLADDKGVMRGSVTLLR